MELVYVVANGNYLDFNRVHKMNAIEFFHIAAYAIDRNKTEAAIQASQWKK